MGNTTWTPPDLSGKAAVVAGATRGSGRGIATALGEAGATVYCTGRSTRAKPSAMGRRETVEETAERVTRAGGTGVPVRVDHLDAAQVGALAERVQREHGGLDLLVNDVWGGDPWIEWGKPFWELDIAQAWRVIENALRTHLVTAHALAPLLAHRRGLLVEVTDGDSYAYRGNLAYDFVKTSVIRLAYTMDQELQRVGPRAVAITPGFLRSEAMLDLFGVREENWRDGIAKDPNFAASETPLYVGRAVASLTADARRATFGGRVWASWTLARRYGFPDADGGRPDWGRHFHAAYGADAQRPLDDTFYAYWRPMDGLDEAVLAQVGVGEGR